MLCASARPLVPAAREATALPGREAPALPGRDATALPGRDATALPGRDATALPGRATSVLPGRATSALPGRETTALSCRDDTALPGRDATTLPDRDAAVLAGRGLGGVGLLRGMSGGLVMPGALPINAVALLGREAEGVPGRLLTLALLEAAMPLMLELRDSAASLPAWLLTLALRDAGVAFPTRPLPLLDPPPLAGRDLPEAVAAAMASACWRSFSRSCLLRPSTYSSWADCRFCNSSSCSFRFFTTIACRSSGLLFASASA